jgi:hypothetical protein
VGDPLVVKVPVRLSLELAVADTETVGLTEPELVQLLLYDADADSDAVGLMEPVMLSVLL